MREGNSVLVIRRMGSFDYLCRMWVTAITFCALLSICSSKFDPYVDNGKTVVGLAGKGFCILASDTRLSEQYSIRSRNTSSVFKVTIFKLTWICSVLHVSTMQKNYKCTIKKSDHIWYFMHLNMKRLPRTYCSLGQDAGQISQNFQKFSFYNRQGSVGKTTKISVALPWRTVCRTFYTAGDQWCTIRSRQLPV